MTESQFPPDFYQREDEQDDRFFYLEPRLVVHIDDIAIAAVSSLFQSLIPPDSMVLDLMSSWRSHWPQGHPKQKLVGLGLNSREMVENPDLDEHLIHNVNQDTVLPFEDDTFDAVVITVSVQYLTSPIETFQQVNRILKPGGMFVVSFSNRMFPTKAVRIWRNNTDLGRIELVESYLEHAGNFEDIHGGFANQDESPPGDPLFVVAARKKGNSSSDD